MQTPVNQRIEDIKMYFGLSASMLAEKMNLRTPQIFYDIKAGKCGISKAMASKITEEYPEINLRWLLTGEGEMLKIAQPEVGYDPADKDTINRLLLLTESQQRTIEMQAEIIRKLTAK